jgi:hypothetical protein
VWQRKTWGTINNKEGVAYGGAFLDSVFRGVEQQYHRLVQGNDMFEQADGAVMRIVAGALLTVMVFPKICTQQRKEKKRKEKKRREE